MFEVLSLDPWTFDQDFQKGWKSLSTISKKIAAIEIYLKLNTKNNQFVNQQGEKT